MSTGHRAEAQKFRTEEPVALSSYALTCVDIIIIVIVIVSNTSISCIIVMISIVMLMIMFVVIRCCYICYAISIL